MAHFPKRWSCGIGDMPAMSFWRSRVGFRIDFQLQNVCFKDFAFLPLPGEMIQFD